MQSMEGVVTMRLFKPVAALAGLSAAALLVACQAAPSTPSPTATTAPAAAAPTAAATTVAPPSGTAVAATPKPGVNQVARIASTVVGAELNPWNQGFPSGYSTRPIFDRLVNYNNYEAQPLLATSWTLVNPTTWEFTLRQGVRFSNGQPMTMEDVIFSIESARDPNISSPTIAASTAGLLDTVTSPSPNVLRITTRTPDVQQLVKMNLLPIIHKATFEAQGKQDFFQKPIGTGPFQVKSFQRDVVVMEPNASYWGPDKARLTEMTISAVPEAGTRLAALAAGQIDLVADVPIDNIPGLASSNAQPLTASFPTMIALLFDTNREEVRDTRVRLAYNLAIDRPMIIRTLQAGLAEEAQGQPLIKAMLGHNPNLQPFPVDIPRARQLMAEAGWASGYTLELPIPNFQASLIPVGEVSATELRNINIQATTRLVDSPTFLADLRGNTLGPVRMSAFDASSGDPFGALQSYQSPARGGAGRWSNPEFDTLFAEQAAEFNPERRAQIIQRMMTIMNQDPPAVFYYGFVYTWGVSNKIDGFTLARNAMPFFENVTRNAN